MELFEGDYQWGIDIDPNQNTKKSLCVAYSAHDLHTSNQYSISEQASDFSMMAPATWRLYGLQAQKAGWEELESLSVSIMRKRAFQRKLPNSNQCALWI